LAVVLCIIRFEHDTKYQALDLDKSKRTIGAETWTETWTGLDWTYLPEESDKL
jgi:hypothetical protein